MTRRLINENFLRQFRDVESRELTRLSAAQFNEVMIMILTMNGFQSIINYLYVNILSMTINDIHIHIGV